MQIKTQTRTTKQIRICNFIRWVLYIVLLALAFILQCTGTYTKALYVIPVGVCIAMSEGVLVAAGIGTLCGFLVDTSCDKLFGSNAIHLLICFVCVSLLFTHLLRHNIINVLLVTGLCALIQGAMDYLFCYFMWGYENVQTAFTHYTLPSILYTILATVPIYLLFRLVKSKLMTQGEIREQ